MVQNNDKRQKRSLIKKKYSTYGPVNLEPFPFSTPNASIVSVSPFK